jgi:hypothetical protein
LDLIVAMDVYMLSYQCDASNFVRKVLVLNTTSLLCISFGVFSLDVSMVSWYHSSSDFDIC